MRAESLAAKGALWAHSRDNEDQTLPLWKAALIALAFECLVPLVVLGVDWSFLPSWEEPLPTPVMSVRLEQPPPEIQPEPQPPRPEIKPKDTPPPPKKIRKRKPAIPIEAPKPVPNEAQSKIELPKIEPEPEPTPPKKEEEKPVPEPPPLPSVFRDVKPVRKVKPIYPRAAEDQHTQGRVKVRLSVDLEGNVTDVQILVAEPPGVFDEAVLVAVRQYKFKQDGTTYQADQEVVFKIDD